MSDKLGPLAYNEPQQEVFLGHAVTQHKNVSDETATLIDKEIRKIIDDAYGRARKILTDHLDHLHLLAKSLLEFETLSGEEIDDLLKTGKFVRHEDMTTKAKSTRGSTPRRKSPKLTPEPQA